MDRRPLILIGIVIAIVGLVILSKYTRGDETKEVEVSAVDARVIRSSILASGSLAYRQEVQLRSELIGKAKAVPVKEGDTVAAGDLIIQLDPEQYQSQVERAQADVQLAEIAIRRQRLYLGNLERQVQRQRELFQRQLIDEDGFETIQNELALAEVDLESREQALSQARAGLDQARDNLAKTEIRSPIDGVIIQLDVEPGEAVIAGTTNIPGSTLAVVADPSSMLTEVQVDEADIAAVTLGQSADIYAAAFPDTPLAGTVESIAASAQQAAGQQGLSFEVKIRLSDPDSLAVRPGMSCRAEIYTQSSDGALAVPVAAVQYDEDESLEEPQPYVFVVVGEVAERRDVELGLSSDSHMEVLSGLSVGDRVVSGPFRTLRHLKDGETVKVTEPSGQEDEEEDDG